MGLVFLFKEKYNNHEKNHGNVEKSEDDPLAILL